MVLTIISFVVVLGILVFFHELGHYLVARRNGIIVEEFGFGYPPRVAKLFTYDGTDFTLNLLPLGGFARMKGEDAGDMSPGSFNGASAGARAATLVAGPIMNFMVAILLFAASFMFGFPADVANLQLTDVPAGSAAAGLGLQTGDVLMSYAGQPLLLHIEADAPAALLHPLATTGEPALVVTRHGEFVTIPVSDPAALKAVVDAGQYVPVLMTEITGIAPDSPAQSGGLQKDDLVYDVDDKVVTPDLPVNVLVGERSGEQVTMTILRDNTWIDLSMTPRVNPPEGQGALGVQIGPATEMASKGILQSLWSGVQETVNYATVVLSLPVMLIRGQLQPADAQLTGPVGIAQMVGGAASATVNTGQWFPILWLSAVLSAALAITNLLPLPALDGGRLLFILIEAVRGRRVSPEREGFIHMVGFMVLLGLMLIITVRDLTSAPQGIDWARLMGQ